MATPIHICFEKAAASEFKSFKLAAVVCKGKVPITQTLSNNHYRQCFRDKVTKTRTFINSTHAEVAAAMKLISFCFKDYAKKQQNLKNLRRHMKKYTLYVVRSGVDDTQEEINFNDRIMKSSKPCKNCVKYLQNIGLTKVVYVDNNNHFQKVNIANWDLNKQHLSCAQRNFIEFKNNNYKC